MNSKKGHSDRRRHRARFEQLDRLIPLLGLGIAAYFASRAAADRRAAESRLADIEGAAAKPLNGGILPAPTTPEPLEHGRIRGSIDRLSRTKKLLVLAMLIALIAYVMGGSTFATFSAETGNPASTVSSGVLTLSDSVNGATACNSYSSASQDNYNPACDAILALTNQAPGVTDTAGTYPGGYATLTIKNTGSINASLFSLFSPFVNATLNAPITSGTTVSSMTVTPLEGPVTSGDKIVLNYGSTTQQFCASAGSAAGSTSITIGSGYTAGNSGSCPASGPNASQVAGTTFAVGTRLNDTSTDTTPSNTDCYDAKTTTSTVAGAKVGTDLNFNPIAGNPFCSAALLWIQEQSTVGANTYNYCWFGRGSPQSTEGGAVEDANGQCRTPTEMLLSAQVVTSAATTTTINQIGGINNSVTSVTVTSGAGFSNGDTVLIDNEEMTISAGGGTTSWTVTRAVNGTTAASHSNGATITKTEAFSLNDGGNLHGNIAMNDTITLADGGSTLTCYATGNNYIGASGTIGVTGCAGAPSTTFHTATTVVKDTTALGILNGTNTTSTISNFDTAHNAGHGAIFMPPLTGNGADNAGSTVQLAAHGDANSKDIRIFYVGVYFPAASGQAQNQLQGLMSTFGLTFHIDQ